MSNADPYRILTPTEVELRALNPHPRIGNGTRDCPKPGFWSRLWHGYRYRDTWTCDCGQEWEWTDAYPSYWRKERHDEHLFSWEKGKKS